MVEGPAREAPASVAAGEVPGDVPVVFELVKIANNRGASDSSVKRAYQARSTEAASVLGQCDHDGELDSVHAHADQRV